MNAFGGSRLQVKAPERGVFPLDHDGECTEPMEVSLPIAEPHHFDHTPAGLLEMSVCEQE